MRGIHRLPVNSPHKGQWRGVLIFSLICAWINGWVNSRETGDLRHHRAQYDVSVMRTCGLWSTYNKVFLMRLSFYYCMRTKSLTGVILSLLLYFWQLHIPYETINVYHMRSNSYELYTWLPISWTKRCFWTGSLVSQRKITNFHHRTLYTMNPWDQWIRRTDDELYHESSHGISSTCWEMLNEL